ncbi:uncharacterized protein LOC107798058 isoform X1 [Nicotiana tabacum]|uniref:Uncharacterized protein LOC107798058 isoform X1 n=2 Tax=Nicotiana tabacum TaxID=4097 RepID=A0AC58S8F7_TOBAC
MDKSWMGMPRNTAKYLLGLNQILDFAFKNGNVRDRIKCPCPKCGFAKWQTRDTVFDHLVCKPFPKNYVTWVMHGEMNVLHPSRDAEIQKKRTNPHTGGSEPNFRRKVQMPVETGEKPRCGQLYPATHKNQDESYVNEETRGICKKVELALRQSTTDEHEVSSNDYVGKVLGNEHPGTVRCLGFGAAPSSSCRQKRLCLGGVNFSSNNDGSYFHECQEKYNQCQEAYNQCQERYNQCKEKYNQLMNALKAYMIMKEGKIPEQFAGIFDSPPITPNDAPTAPSMDARSSGGSNSSGSSH